MTAAEEVQRIGADYGLGRHVKAWHQPEVVDRILTTGILIGVVLVAVGETVAHRWRAEAMPFYVLASVGLSMALVLLGIGMVLFRLPLLHEYEGGLANVTRAGRRVTVVRWADLDSVHEKWNHETDHILSWVLRDHAGNEVELPNRGKRRDLIRRAEQILASRAHDGNRPTT
jgi:hypothetical protein